MTTLSYSMGLTCLEQRQVDGLGATLARQRMGGLSEAGTFMVLTIMLGGTSGAGGGLLAWWIRGRVEHSWKIDLQTRQGVLDGKLQQTKSEVDGELEQVRWLIQRRTAKLSRLDSAERPSSGDGLTLGWRHERRQAGGCRL